MNEAEWQDLLGQLTPDARMAVAAQDLVIRTALSESEADRYRQATWNVYYEGYANGTEIEFSDKPVEDARGNLTRYPLFPGQARVSKHAYKPDPPYNLSCQVCSRGRYHPAHRDELGNKL